MWEISVPPRILYIISLKKGRTLISHNQVLGELDGESVVGVELGRNEGDTVGVSADGDDVGSEVCGVPVGLGVVGDKDG